MTEAQRGIIAGTLFGGEFFETRIKLFVPEDTKKLVAPKLKLVYIGRFDEKGFSSDYSINGSSDPTNIAKCEPLSDFEDYPKLVTLEALILEDSRVFYRDPFVVRLHDRTPSTEYFQNTLRNPRVPFSFEDNWQRLENRL